MNVLSKNTAFNRVKKYFGYEFLLTVWIQILETQNLDSIEYRTIYYLTF